LPLEFNSISHGRIAFGFFNIETDILLMEQCFFFAPQFCSMIGQIAENSTHKCGTISLDSYLIDNLMGIGNLMGAINGIDLQGFIGQVYRKFPFPKNPEGFKQKPYGAKNRAVIEKLLEQWATPVIMQIKVEPGKLTIKIGEYIFSKKGFHDIIAYVWHGGMPGWEDGIRPGYVMEIKKIIDESKSPIFDNFKP